MTDDDGGGLEPAQVLVRLVGWLVLALAVAAMIASRDDIRRYVRMKQM